MSGSDPKLCGIWVHADVDPETRQCPACGAHLFGRCLEDTLAAKRERTRLESPEREPKTELEKLVARARGIAWWARSLAQQSPAPAVMTPAAETRSAEDYEEAAWSEAFREEMEAVRKAKNEKWRLWAGLPATQPYTCPGCHRDVQCFTPPGVTQRKCMVCGHVWEDTSPQPAPVVPDTRPMPPPGRFMGMGDLDAEEREALHGARRHVTLTDADEPRELGETSMYVNDVNKYAPPGGKLLKSDVEADGTIRHTFSTGDGLEVSCAIMAPHTADKERECLESFKAEWTPLESTPVDLASTGVRLGEEGAEVVAGDVEPGDDEPEPDDSESAGDQISEPDEPPASSTSDGSAPV